MRLEDEINQKKFQSESHKLAVNIIYTYNWLNAHQSGFLKSFGITPQQFNVLRILRGLQGQPASVKVIRERMLDKMSDASRIVEKLRLKGLIKRTTCSSDRRACDVFITDKGLLLLSKIDTENEVMNRMFHHLTDAEKQQMNSLLDSLRGSASSIK